MKKNNKGFTLVELIVVIAILGVLMAVLIPQYIQYVEKSRIGVDENYIGEVAHNMELAAAANEKINGKSVSVTLKQGTGQITLAKEDENPQNQEMLNELAAVFPDQFEDKAENSEDRVAKTGTEIYKSKAYGGDDGYIVTIELQDDGTTVIDGGRAEIDTDKEEGPQESGGK